MQDVVVHRIPELFSTSQNSWTAASLPLGAGVPDLVVVSYDPQVLALTHVDLTDAQILAYLRAVRKARLETIVECRSCGPAIPLSCLIAPRQGRRPGANRRSRKQMCFGS